MPDRAKSIHQKVHIITLLCSYQRDQTTAGAIMYAKTPSTGISGRLSNNNAVEEPGRQLPAGSISYAHA